jgi:hypothetical protein
MENFILNELGDKPPEEVKDLDLEGLKLSSFTPDEKAYLEKFSNLESLSLSSSGLASLQNFPILPNLISLNLNNTHLSSGFSNLKPLTELLQICLSNSEVSSTDELSSLGDLPCLICLELSGSPVCERPEYRETLFSLIPSLQLVDGINREGNEMSLSDIDSEASDSLEDSEDSKDSKDFEDSDSSGPITRKK